MGLYVRSRLRASPILNVKTFSLRSTVSLLINISEPSPLGMVTILEHPSYLERNELEGYTNRPSKLPVRLKSQEFF